MRFRIKSIDLIKKLLIISIILNYFSDTLGIAVLANSQAVLESNELLQNSDEVIDSFVEDFSEKEQSPING